MRRERSGCQERLFLSLYFGVNGIFLPLTLVYVAASGSPEHLSMPEPSRTSI